MNLTGYISSYRAVFDAIVAHPRYRANLNWGKPRPGHPEGDVRTHIVELETNLETLNGRLTPEEYWKLKVLIHTHDSFKAESERDVPVTQPTSHASIARAFLAEFCDDADLLAIVQYHDEPYAIWQQARIARRLDLERFAALLQNIKDWNVFLAFVIIDGCTEGKRREPLHQLFAQVAGKVDARFTAADIL